MSRPQQAPRLQFLVVGSPRSGTTLVQRIAAGVEGVAVPPETHFFTVGIPAAGWPRAALDPQTAESLLRRYATLDVTAGLALDLDRLIASLPVGPTTTFELFGRLVGHLAGPDAEVVGEKTPHHLRWVAPLTGALPHLKVIGVLRDPRAVVASNLAVEFGMRHADVLADMWRDDLRRLRSARRRLGATRCLLLRYEQVVARPDAASAAIRRFLGTDTRPARQVSPEEIYVPGEAGHKGRVTGAIDASRAQAWRAVLTTRQVAVIEAVCGRDMARVGYDGDSRGSARAAAMSDTRVIARLAAHRVHRLRDRSRIARHGT